MTDAAALTVPAIAPQTDNPAALELNAEWMGSPERFFNRETYFVTHYDDVVATLLDDRFSVDGWIGS